MRQGRFPIRYNPGLVGGELQLAVLEKRKGAWVARHEDPGETEQQVDYLEKYFTEFSEMQKPEAAAKASKVNLDEALGTDVPIAEENGLS